MPTPITSTLQTVFESGGWVMWPLLALSVLSVGLSVERILFWSVTHRPGRRRWLASLGAALRRGDASSVRAVCARDGSVYSAVAQGLMDREHIDAALVEFVEQERPRIERFSGVLSTIVTAAPLLGILGTVTGIIESFRLLGAGGAGAAPVTDPSAVASGIAEALITTAFGLVVALVTLFPYVAFRASINRCLGRIEALGASAIEGRNRAAKPRHDTTSAAPRPEPAAASA